MQGQNIDIRKIPWILSTLIALLWGFVYVFFGKLHGMWTMFNKGFTFLLATILPIHIETMSVFSIFIIVIIDGLVIGLLFAWLAWIFLKKFIEN